jgi:rhodanese-related sulfurtransferase
MRLSPAQFRSQEQGMPITRGYRALVDEAMGQVRTYTVEQVRERMGQPGLQLVDIRDIRELQHEGTVPGSFHAPRGMLEFWVDPESPYFKKLFADEDKEFVLFCGAGWRSALAAKTLQDMGMSNVAHIDGGFTEWVRQGAPTETLEQRKAAKGG